MKLLLCVLGVICIVSGQRGDIGFLEEDVDDFNAPVDNWDEDRGDGWGYDTPTWETGTGPVVSAQTFAATNIQYPQKDIYDFNENYGYIGQLGKHCKVIKGYGKRINYHEIYQSYNDGGSYNNGYPRTSSFHQFPSYAGNYFNYQNNHQVDNTLSAVPVTAAGGTVPLTSMLTDPTSSIGGFPSYTDIKNQYYQNNNEIPNSLSAVPGKNIGFVAPSVSAFSSPVSNAGFSGNDNSHH
ncbi:unnamed protein product [Mytilus coruscus]|uniref:Uncharacterized protein n=1 Tax=Mytilus coruscus TaxID=42192 RepID=A0A6J8B3K0_MYTCO|nr:unnamed protein product [Mytilus coruscus]